MTEIAAYLIGEQQRGRWMRLDTAEILKRFHFCERSLVLSMGAWLPWIGPIEVKTGLPRHLWQSALTADALRERVFELRYPVRLLNLDNDEPLAAVFDAGRDAPSPVAFLLGLCEVLLPALRDAYAAYLRQSDPLADGPTHRFLTQAVADKAEQIAAIGEWSRTMLPPDAEAHAWVEALSRTLTSLGGVPVEGTVPHIEIEPLPRSRPYHIPDVPARDGRFHLCRFYWPDVIDPNFPYGEGIGLQVRSAVSHLNEAWAVETAGAVLWAFADLLPWEWVRDAARWTYDESRHCRMGYERLRAWGFTPEEIPLGNYIYLSSAGQDPLYRLGMLFFFETKNIGKKPARARLFHGYGDAVSEHDMDFDWADETIHAHYGKQWLSAILEQRGEDARNTDAIRKRCSDLVAACVASATDEERQDITAVANALLARARQMRQE